MRKVNMHEAKTHLSKLVDGAVNGEPFIIAKAGKALVKVVAIDAENPDGVVPKIGFLKQLGPGPDDIKTPFKDEIEEMFYGSKIFAPDAIGEGAQGDAESSQMPAPAPQTERDR